MDFGTLAPFLPVLYPLIVLAVAADAFIPPLPAEVLTITAGAMSARGDANLPLTLLTAFLGCWAGDLLVYTVFRRELTRVLLRWRWGRAVVRQLDAAIARAGESATDAALIAVRFLPGGRTASMAAAGIGQVPARRVLIFGGLGAAVWAVWTVGLGFATGSTTDLPTWVSAALGSVVGIASGAVIAGIMAWRARRRDRHGSIPQRHTVASRMHRPRPVTDPGADGGLPGTGATGVSDAPTRPSDTWGA